MRRFSLVMGSVFVLVCLLLAAIQGWMGELSGQVLRRLEQIGYFAVGWGTSVTGWLLSGHLSVSCLLSRVPTTWRLFQKEVLDSPLPILKYVAAGLLFTGLFVVLGHHVWGLFTHAFDAGLLVGAISGFVYSLRKVSRLDEDQIDLLESNQRYLNEEKVPLFSDDWT